MRYYGILIGAVLGLLVLRPPILGILLGAVIGYLIDTLLINRPRGGGGVPRTTTAYDVLGIGADASDAEVEQAYRRMMSQYHPDKVAGAADEIRQLAEERAQAINRAYEDIMRQRRGRQ